MAIVPVVMCGGAGTRLWPASRPSRPKQFLPLMTPRSMFQETLLRLQSLPDLKPPVIVAGAKHKDFIAAQLAELGMTATVLLEPEPRDSGPAIAAAMAVIAATDPDDVAVVLASDHHVPSAEAFAAAVAQAAELAARGYIVTLGVRPTSPSSAYGYIQPGDAIVAGRPGAAVLRFAEKPDADAARQYVADGYLWNSGNFIAPAGLMLAEIARFEPAMAKAVQDGVSGATAVGGGAKALSDAFRGSPKISIDYAVMEKTKQIAVLPVDFAWSDLGAWDAVHEADERDGEGNATRGQTALVDVAGSIVRAAPGMTVAAVGVKNLAIIAEADAVLVCDLDSAQGVKTAVEAMKAKAWPQTDIPAAAVPAPTLKALSAQLDDWLDVSALPLWWSLGADHAGGGYRDLLSLEGRPVASPRRARVQMRQVYVYAAAGMAGWGGPWKTAVAHGLDYFDARYRLPNGLFRTTVNADGSPLDDTVAVYDQAFAMMGSATAVQADPSLGEWRAKAEAVLKGLNETRRHKTAGFVESGAAPYQSNCHMHLLEAALAWMQAGGGPEWKALASEIIELCMSRFIDAEGGYLREFFDADWNPAPGIEGRIVEPGHQFEWSWLLARWSKIDNSPKAAAAARRLFECGVMGVDPRRGVAVDEMFEDLTVKSARARLWPQTERIKAAAILADIYPADAAWFHAEAAAAAQGLMLYLQTPARGVWRDKLLADGTWFDEPAPASSLYHIACAILELRSRLAG